MSTSVAEGSYKPITGPYSASATDLVLTFLPESSSLSSSIPPEIHVTTLIRAALRSAQADLNEECAKTANVKFGLEKTDLEYSRLQLEKRSLQGAVATLRVDPDDAYYGQALAKARYKWELEQIAEREELAASLQTRLEDMRRNSSLLKRKAILADSTLDDLQKLMAKAKQALAEVVLPGDPETGEEEGIEMEPTETQEEEEEVAASSPLSSIDA
ncbi:hypothetical protein QFC22_005505 [Naganishia vaughanmartiniae]|uniref:Uncharacterized protein n=1 Tax=Naganishia vaughanmartiniae TaxID=1424756 RepID=A0ACC2WVR5_9TREE|nr:hypothetical protein QFC22_005505 [Naganishia vaughanmartiniae]